MKVIFVYALEFMLTLDKIQNISTLLCKVRNLWAEYFERYSTFSYCTHNTVHVYRVF